MALALYKQSGTGYKLLSRMFALPSRVTLMKLLNRIPLYPGLNECVFDCLKGISKGMRPLERHCFLVFDEMSLTPHLHYNQFSDTVEGFENFGDQQTHKIADHVQVFMLTGIARLWKQPIVYQFVKGAEKGPQIMSSIKQIIIASRKAGINIVGTICDQGTNNVSAISQLVEETRQEYVRNGKECTEYIFEVDGQKIIPFFDPPHLLKGVRNNLLDKDISFEIDGVRKIAKWQDIYTAWQLDAFSGNLRVMPKLTEHHVDTKKIKKMKVSVCAQVFSHTVSSAVNLMAKSEYAAKDGAIKMESRATDTAEFLHFMDNLFDSVNGSLPFNKHGKQLKTAVDVNAEKSVHTEFWQNALVFFDKMYCIQNGKRITPPSFKNWKVTLRSFLLLKQKLKNLGFKRFRPRYVNQDPLENFFGRIRQRRQRFVNPTCSAFGPFYKSLLVNNLVSKHSVGSNCEEDNSNILMRLHNFVTQGLSEAEEERKVEAVFMPAQFDQLKPLEASALTYVAGYIVKLKLNLQRNCNACTYNILKRPNEDNNSLYMYINAKEYGGAKLNRLTYCNHPLLLNLIAIYNIVRYILKTVPFHSNIIEKVIITLNDNMHFNFVPCEHAENVKHLIFKHFS